METWCYRIEGDDEGLGKLIAKQGGVDWINEVYRIDLLLVYKHGMAFRG